MSIVRNNLMTREGYTPYCGAANCTYRMPRTVFNGSQFRCLCGWHSQFEAEFIDQYKQRWSSQLTRPERASHCGRRGGSCQCTSVDECMESGK